MWVGHIYCHTTCHRTVAPSTEKQQHTDKRRNGRNRKDLSVHRREEHEVLQRRKAASARCREMDVVKSVCTIAQAVLGVAKNIADLYEKARYNKKQCARLTQLVKMLMVPVEKIQKEPQKNQSEDILRVLTELLKTMENAKSWVKKYTGWRWWVKLFRIYRIKEEFEQLMGRLRDAVGVLSLQIQVDKRQKFSRFFDEMKLKGENEEAIKADLMELQGVMVRRADGVDACVQQVGLSIQDVKDTLESVLIKMESDKELEKLGVLEIRMEDLKVGEKLMETGSSILYKGEYLKGTVAIKCFKNPPTCDSGEVKTIFKRETKVMNKFNYSNIMRLYGICIDNTGLRPSYSIVMEYCAKGTLRELLKNETSLSWETRIDVCVGAARALYRLHHTVSNPVVHQNIDSTKFLVDGCFCVKLAGFELTQTESSMKRNPINDTLEATTLAFCCPEKLEDINFPYNKACDIYSFGIVLWEIVTGEIPLKGLNACDIKQELCGGFQKPLPACCPMELKDLIDLCRANEPSLRPTAGVVVDTLADFQKRM